MNAIRRWIKSWREAAYVPPAWAPGELTALVEDQTELLFLDDDPQPVAEPDEKPAAAPEPEPEPYSGRHRLLSLQDWWAWPGPRRDPSPAARLIYVPRHFARLTYAPRHFAGAW